MSTEENNKLIAMFMGGEDKGRLMFHSNVIEFKTENKSIVKSFKYGDLLYSSDWNWLMEVVEKIEVLGYSSTIIGNLCIIARPNFKSIRVEQETKIEAVYNACLDFIKWYNEQKIKS